MKIVAISQAGQTQPGGAPRRRTVPDAPDFKQCIAEKKKTAAKPAKGQPEPTDAQLKAPVPAGVRPAPRPGPAVPDPLDLARPGGQPAERQGRRQDVVKQIDDIKKQQFAQKGSFQKFLQSAGLTNEDVLYQQRIRELQNQITDEGHQGQGQGHRRPDRGLLQQEQVALRPARAPRPAHRPDQDEGEGRAGQEGARLRPVLEGGRQEVLDRPGLQEQGRRAARRGQGPAGAGLRRGDLRGQEGQAHRPGQDAVRLLRLRGHEGHAEPSSSRSRSPRRRSSRSSPPRTSRRR